MPTIAPPVRAYELWYEYLMETKPETWSAEVRRDFSGALTAGSFEKWFSADVRLSLFRVYGSNPKNMPARILMGGKDEEWITKWLHRLDDLEDDADDPSKHTVLVVNLDYPRAFLMEKIERILTRKQPKKKAGRPDWKAPHSKYTFARRPDISSLEIALAAYRLKKSGIANWQVGNELAKSFPILQDQKIKERELAKSLPILQGQETRGKVDPTTTAKKKVLESAASRYLKMADVVLAGVAKGVFPAK